MKKVYLIKNIYVARDPIVRNSASRELEYWIQGGYILAFKYGNRILFFHNSKYHRIILWKRCNFKTTHSINLNFQLRNNKPIRLKNVELSVKQSLWCKKFHKNLNELFVINISTTHYT